MKVALVYDRVNKWGGAERILLALHNLFPDAPLYTSVYNRSGAPWAKKFKVVPSFLQKIPLASLSHERFAPLMPLAFETFSFDEFDVVISVTSEAAKGIVTKPETLHICYMLTPTRYLWSGYFEYFRNGFTRFFAHPFVSYLRFWDCAASFRPDKIIAISETVEKRIKEYYDRDSEVVYPPVVPAISKKPKKIKEESESFFLIVSRMVPYKRIDLAIKAFNRLGYPLKIIGRGHGLAALKEIANENVEFIDWVSDAELFWYYEHAEALIFTGVEDFGLVMVEAQLAGTPVIAYKAGGATEIIKNNVTGVFFKKQTISSLVRVLKTFRKKRYNKQKCRTNGKRFSQAKFEWAFRKSFNRACKIYFSVSRFRDSGQNTIS